jgi:hypothetical protein
MEMLVPFVRAKTSDGHWASVRIDQLDEPSYKLVVLDRLCRVGVLVGVLDDNAPELKTPLTKAQAETLA